MIAMTTVEDLVRPVADDIRRMAPQAEAERRLPKDLVDKLARAGLLSIYTPREFGGLDLPLPDALRVIEEVSRHDGSTGWTVTVNIANAVFTSVLSQSAAAQILGDGSPLISSAPAFRGRAVAVEGGYRITARWPFNSGAPNATSVGVAVPVFDDNTPRVGESGPEMIFAFLPPSVAQVIDTWHVTGLRATGTQDLNLEDVFVPVEMTGGFSLPAGPRPIRECVLCNVPFFTLLGVSQAPPVCLGIARRAIEEFKQLALTKESDLGPRLIERVQAQDGIARAEALVQSARTYFFEQVQMTWDAANQARSMSVEERAAVRLACLTAAENSVAAVDILYRLGGSSTIFQTSPIERCWRDVHTAAQHMQVQATCWQSAGRVLLGLEPDSPVL